MELRSILIFQVFKEYKNLVIIYSSENEDCRLFYFL
jgi:hypothetical protein